MSQTAMLDLRRAAERGHADFGWLDSRHTFSFGEYFDPAQVGFSDLRVINDDRVAPGAGFPTHPHRDMEIISYVLEGELEHRDSMGNGSVIRPGDVQMMSAGRGITHSEFNPSHQQPVHFLQIWIVPERRGVVPRYQQTRFDAADKRGRLHPIITPDGADGTLGVYQDVRMLAGLFDAGDNSAFEVPSGRHAYVHVARGRLAVNGTIMEASDGARVRQAGTLVLNRGEDAEVLVFDLRARERPGY